MRMSSFEGGGIDGREIALTARKANPNVKLINNDRILGVNAGRWNLCDAAIHKRGSDLLETLEQIIETPR